MEWFSQNWVWVLFFTAFVAMHLFGHGGHGGASDDADHNAKPASEGNARTASNASPHQH